MLKSIWVALLGAVMSLSATAQTGAATSGVSQERTPAYSGTGFTVSSALSEANAIDWTLDTQASDTVQDDLNSMVTVRGSDSIFVYTGNDFMSALSPIANLNISGSGETAKLERFAHNFTTDAGRNRVTVQLRNDGKLAIRYSLRDESKNEYIQTGRFVYTAAWKWSEDDVSSLGTVDTDRLESFAPN